MFIVRTKGEGMLQLNLHRFKKSDSLKTEIESLGEEIQEMLPKANVTVGLVPQSRKEGRKQKLFKLSVVIRQKKLSLVLTRKGTHVYQMIHDLKHDVIRKLHALKEKRITARAHRTRLSKFQGPNEDSLTAVSS
jgi:hypothetical protein